MPKPADDIIPVADNTVDIGTNSIRVKTFYGRTVQAIGDTGASGQGARIYGFAQSGTDRPTLNLFRSRDNAGAAASVQNGDQLGGVIFQGWNNAQWLEGAFVRSGIWGTPSGTDLPAMLEFGTTPAGGTGATSRWRMVADGTFQPAADSTYDIGATATRVRNVYSDQWHSVAPNIGVNVGTGANVTLGSKAVDGIAAGDVLRFDAWVLFLNNTAASKTYSLWVDIGSTFALVMSTNSLAQNATNKLPVHLKGIISVVSTSSCFTAQRIEHAVISSSSSSDVSATTTTFDASAWASAATNLTGTQTVSLLALGASGATQTADMLSFIIERFRP